MRKKSKTNFKIIIAITTLLITMFSTISFASGEQATLDITPPRGKLEIKNMKQIDNINYVDTANVTFEVTAFDDICEPTEIKYYYSLTEIVDEPPMWYDYAPGNTHDITLTNPSGTNTIYAVFKDNVGNTSLIYGDTGYTIQYNKNADDAVMFTSTVATTGYYGMGFMVTMQTPTRDGYYFAGWSTSPDATEVNFKRGEIIPADTFVGGGKTINLYAVWTQSTNGAVLLADVAEIGDYVNYPVTYDNVPTSGSSSYVSKYNGWRVISKNVDLDGVDSPGTVNLVSAGVPLTFEAASGTNSATLLKDSFFDIGFGDTGSDIFYKTGFLYKSLKESFTNQYTVMKADGVTPMVRPMVQEDIFRITGHTAMATGTTMNLSDAKWEQLFGNGAYYYLASAYSSSNLWHVGSAGTVSSNSSERGLRPVVSLKPTVIATGQDAVGAWNIEVAG